ncbi:probable arginine--tRNA ligase, mitochondrial [Ceratina calcarata]|uniref:Probable arginine--tRNA ligase, mitochondrial n=1 Tax=Ceratina calcarata TaxID=156304 RepID=A0AAJ7IUB3_9HYME|nr:probable arginine--tRNA ligase, mitochondrial [Ceratina calcarata]
MFLNICITTCAIRPLRNIDNAYKHKILTNLHIRFNKFPDTYSFVLPLKSEDYDITNELKDITNIDLSDCLDNVTVEGNDVYFQIQRDKYVKRILESNVDGVAPPLAVDSNKNVIVEFSSPNIAKPFHLGHLRSTVVGNCIANLKSFVQNQVTRINYLGDWGTQFGYIHVGMELTNVDNIEVQKDPIKILYNAYVNANKIANDDPGLHERAKEIFTRLELGDDKIYENWQKIKQFTTVELENTYKRLGIAFDKYDWESMYTAKNINRIIKLMDEMNVLTLDDLNRKVVFLNEEKAVPIIKSDGSTLYISRDIAAAIDRFEKYKFDAMYYVVDYSQTEHFSNLIQILSKMKLPWADRLRHVKFGRVEGMSTRKGTAVFLEDILNEAKELMGQKQILTTTTKVHLDEIEGTSDILGVSGMIVQNLKQNRMNNYKFSLESMLDMKGDSGIKLQYVHCRLCSLEELSGATLVTECDPSLLKEPIIDHLIILISRFDEIVLESHNELEPCTLTVYLFHLCKTINIVWRDLRVKDEPSDLANQRLMLFHVAKVILAQGMRLLGLIPLEKM